MRLSRDVAWVIDESTELFPGHSAELWLQILLFSTIASILGYVFIQDWFYSFLCGNYVGYGYALWVSFIFALLLDWVFLRGRVTEGVMNVIGSMVSSLG